MKILLFMSFVLTHILGYQLDEEWIVHEPPANRSFYTMNPGESWYCEMCLLDPEMVMILRPNSTEKGKPVYKSCETFQSIRNEDVEVDWVPLYYGHYVECRYPQEMMNYQLKNVSPDPEVIRKYGEAMKLSHLLPPGDEEENAEDEFGVFERVPVIVVEYLTWEWLELTEQEPTK